MAASLELLYLQGNGFLDETALSKLNMSKMTNLRSIHLRRALALRRFPPAFFGAVLPKLSLIDLDRCVELEVLPTGAGCNSVQHLCASLTSVKEYLNSTFKDYGDSLETLTLSYESNALRHHPRNAVIEAGVFQKTTRLKALEFNNMPRPPVDIFANLRSLTQLRLYNTHLDYGTEPQGWKGLLRDATELTSIQLSSTEMRDPAEGFFSGLPKLTSLALSSTYVLNLPRDFNAMTALRRLYLCNTRITSIPDDMFVGFSRLEYLCINQLKNLMSISDRAFEPLADNLTELVVSGCPQISKFFPSKAFQSLRSLTSLNIMASVTEPKSRLAKLPDGAFRGMTKLRVLFLNNHRITSLSDDAFLDLSSSLGYLQLIGNRLRRFPTAALQNLTKLTWLSLAENRLSALQTTSFPQGLTSLRRLILRSNRISSITPSTWEPLISLTSLFLSSNLLQRLPSRPFQSLGSLTQLDLRMNRLTHISDLLGGLSKLRKL